MIPHRLPASCFRKVDHEAPHSRWGHRRAHLPGLAVAEAFIAPARVTKCSCGDPVWPERKIIPAYGFRLLEIEARPFAGQSVLLSSPHSSVSSRA
jgi:hypothetical protein